jgi:thiamine transport system permease protein
MKKIKLAESLHIDLSNKLIFALLPALLFLGVFYFYPLIKIFFISFFNTKSFESSGISSLISSFYYLKTIGFTIWQAALSTILTLIFAMPSAYIFARYSFFGKKALFIFTTIPFVLPTVVVAASFHSLLGKYGIVNSFLTLCFDTENFINIDNSIWIILLAHIFFNYTIVLRIVGGFWAQIDSNIENAAVTLGSSPFKTFFKITLPILKPAIIAASILVFIFCFSSFGIILILGGPKFSTIEVEIYRQAVHLFNLPMASILSLIQIIFLFIFMWIYAHLQRRASISLNPKILSNSLKTPSSFKEKAFIYINNIIIIFFLGAPLLSLFISSFLTESGIGIKFYQALFQNRLDSIFYIPPVQAAGYSILFAFITIAISLTIGLLASFALSKKKKTKSIFDPIFMLPLATSAVTLGLGFIVALNKPPLNLRNSIMLVPIAHSLVAYPFVIRSILPAISSIPKNLKDAAASLGASPFAVFKNIDLPVITRGLVTASIFAFAISMGEFGASIFTARPQTPTMPIAIYRFLNMPGSINYGQAMAMSSILMFVTGIGVFLLEKLGIKNNKL